MLSKNIEVSGLNVFYREAGREDAPKLVLLHGFPASSRQHRNLLSGLGEQFHDYPGFGNSEIPDRGKCAYAFDKISEIIEGFLAKLEFTHFRLYVQGYGGPVGFHIVARRPDWLEWLIVQNTNAYEVGFTPIRDGLRSAYWKSRNGEVEKYLEGFFEAATIRQIYRRGHRKPAESAFPHRIQLDLFYDFQTNLHLYPHWQAFLRRNQPKTIIFWGQNNIFFTREGGESYLKDVPRWEMRRLNSGHFAIEDSLQYIAEAMVNFYRRACPVAV